MDKTELNKLIKLWFEEDIRGGDCTSLCCIPPDEQGTQQLLIKEEGILAGVEVAKAVIEYFDERLVIKTFLHDGMAVKRGDIAFTVTGSVLSMLQIERTMLNILQHLSGIATTTHHYQSLIADTGCFVLDTRKTTPGLRYLEKEAVRIGGGKNHRIGLFDMILLKDNHIDFCGGITPALQRAQAYREKTQPNLKIEIETRNENEVREALAANIADRIMLDNMSVEQTRDAVQIIRAWEHTHGRKIEIESSGGITQETLRAYALCGIDYASVGALTHSVKNLDMSFKAIKV